MGEEYFYSGHDLGTPVWLSYFDTFCDVLKPLYIMVSY